MALRFIDLHTHTTASDGSDSPANVVRMAAGLSLAAVAITDHDTVAGLEEGEREAARHELEFVRGCEISTRMDFGEVHLLGLWLPKDTARFGPFEEVLAQIRDARTTRNRLMIERLRDQGLDVTYEDVEKLAGGNVVGRPHFAELLMVLGLVNNRNQAFQQYLRPGGKAYVPRILVSPEEGVEALAACTRCVALAHPCLGRQSREDVEHLVARLVPLGLTAIEAYHSEHSAADERFCVELASRYKLALTGGSDYHGLGKPSIHLGSGKGSLRVTTDVLDKLKRLIT